MPALFVRKQILHFIAVAVVVSSVVAAATISAPAQETPSADAASTARDRLYAELDAAVTAMEKRHGNVLKKLVRLVKPTVVHIEARSTRQIDTGGFVARRPSEETGSGVIVKINSKHYVITNRHVVKHAEPEGIEIKLDDGRVLRPLEILSDPGTDLAVLRVRAEKLVAARLGDSNKMEIGDFVLAVGSPFGLSHSMTYGIISAKGRRDLKLGTDGVRFQNFMQTDAAINPGNSGGPLINLRGQVIGINTAIASASGGNEGIGFTIPINMVKAVADQLIESGTVKRAFLGVHLDAKYNANTAIRLGLPRLVGARVSGITPGSPAAGAQIQQGDIILKFNNVPIEDDNHLVNLVSLTPIGTVAPVVVYRDGRSLQFEVKVTNRRRFDPR